MLQKCGFWGGAWSTHKILRLVMGLVMMLQKVIQFHYGTQLDLDCKT